MHDSVALSGELEARKAEEQITLDAIIPLHHQYGGHVNPDLLNFTYFLPRRTTEQLPTSRLWTS